MKLLSISALPLCLLLSAGAFADRVKHIDQTVDASMLASVRLEISVGELEIETYDGDEIQLEIDIEAKRSWLSWRRRDIEDVELEVRESNSRVYLSIDERNIEQHWRVRMPAKLALDIDVGVGEIRIEDFSNDLEMEVGVGSVRIEVADTDYGLIHVEAGVGDATIRGFSGSSHNERSFVSADASYRGEGDKKIEIEVGVGDVVVINR